MSEQPTLPQIIPYLYYEDAGPAIEFLSDTFGFTIEQAFRDPETDRVLHATVSTGSGVIFVGPGMSEFGTCGNSDPSEVSAMTYVFVDDVNAHYEKVKQTDANILAELHEHFGGNRQYTVNDPFGQRWTFAQPIAGAG